MNTYFVIRYLTGVSRLDGLCLQRGFIKIIVFFIAQIVRVQGTCLCP